MKKRWKEIWLSLEADGKDTDDDRWRLISSQRYSLGGK